MPTEIILPRVDMDMTEGRISRWYVAEGATVAKGQPIFEMETDKAAMEIEAPAAGVIRNLSDKLDTPLPVGAPVAWIFGEGEKIESAKRRPTSPRERGEVEQAARPRSEGEGVGEVALTHPAPHPNPLPASGEREWGPRATPLARRLAREHGLDLATIAGSGPKGRVQAQDVEAAAPNGSVRPLSSPTRIAQRTEGRGSSISPREDGVPSPRFPSERLAGNDAPHRQWLRQGEGTPLVLLHGFGADLNAWRLFIATLQPRCPVLGIDLPGHGGSAGLRVSGFAEMVAAVAGALEAEKLGAVHLTGHSLGGAVAAALAARAGIAARSLFLLAPGGLGPHINGAFVDGLIRAGSKASLAPWLSLLASRPDALGQAFTDATLRSLSAQAARDALRAVAGALFPDGTQAFSVRDVLDGIAMPTKVVFGTGDRIIPAEHADGLPGRVAVHRFAGIGHMPHVEARDDVAALQHEAMWAAADR